MDAVTIVHLAFHNRLDHLAIGNSKQRCFDFGKLFHLLDVVVCNLIDTLAAVYHSALSGQVTLLILEVVAKGAVAILVVLS